jgi:hypothetical protein
LPATVSKRENRRKRLEKERQAIERMVEEKLSAGSYTPGDILMTALTMPLSGGHGPRSGIRKTDWQSVPQSLDPG